MLTSGARFSKLKLVYKKAVQEMLNIPSDETTLDSFYNISVSNSKDKLDTFQSQLDSLQFQLSDLFLKKISDTDLETKLNTLDSLLLEGREVRDLDDEAYIKEILESYFVDEKMSLIQLVNEEEKKLKDEVTDLERERDLLEKEYDLIKKEVISKEKRINNMIEEHIEVFK